MHHADDHVVQTQGVRVPSLGFGTWELRGGDCHAAVTTALEVGYRHIDTARIYGNEAEVGEALEASGVPREEVFVVTKVWMDEATPDRIPSAVAESAERLRGTIDLVLIHWPQGVDIPAAVEALHGQREKGHLRHVGVSNFSPAQMREALDAGPILANQVEYHPFLDRTELIAACQQSGVMLTAYSPLARGKTREDETLTRIADRHGKQPTQVALRWLVQREGISAIPRSGNPEHIRANADLFDFELSADEMEQISALARGERLTSPPG